MFETTDIKRRMDENATDTALGEPQWWIYLSSGRSIEITFESDGLPNRRRYYSIRLHCSDTEFDDDKFRGTCGVVDQDVTDDIGDKDPDELRDEAVSLAIRMMERHGESPASEN